MVVKQSSILKELNNRQEEINVIRIQTSLEMNFLLATLLELELTGKVENIGGQPTVPESNLKFLHINTFG